MNAPTETEQVDLKPLMSPDGEVILHFRVKGVGWAEIYITAEGQLTAQSDYGNFGYWWSPPQQGDRMAEFLKLLLHLKDSANYFTTKLAGGESVFYGANVHKSIDAFIQEAKKGSAWDEEDIEKEVDLLAEHDVHEFEGFCNWAGETNIGDPWERFHSTQHPPRVVAFVERVLIPILLPAIERYLENPQHDRRI